MTTSDIRGSDPKAYQARYASYRKSITPARALIDAEEIRKLLACIEGEASPRTKECQEYRSFVLGRLSAIVEGFGYPSEKVEEMNNDLADDTPAKRIRAQQMAESRAWIQGVGEGIKGMTDDQLEDLRHEVTSGTTWIDRITVGHLLDRLDRTEAEVRRLQSEYKRALARHDEGMP